MLKIIVKPKELWDEINEEFITNNKETVLQLEHSLVSVSKWESKYCKPFYARDEKQAVKTDEEILYYIKCMTITQNVGDEVYKSLSKPCCCCRCCLYVFKLLYLGVPIPAVRASTLLK